MAQPREGNHTGRDVETAIARVLDAERGARAAVDASQREAEAIRAAARARDKRIAETAAARIAAIHAAMAEKRVARLAGIEAEGVGPDPQAADDEAARAHLDQAVARLADEMIGGEAAE
jgi:hypothetical protein